MTERKPKVMAPMIALLILMSGISPDIVKIAGIDVAALLAGGLLLICGKSAFAKLVRGSYHPFALLFLLTIVVVGGASVVWSDTPGPALMEAVTLVIVLGAALVLAAALTLLQFLFCISIASAIIALVSFGMIWDRDIAFTPSGDFRGVFLHKNSLGRVMGYGIVASSAILIFSANQFRKEALAALLVATATLVFARSATPLVAAVLAASTMFVFRSARRARLTGPWRASLYLALLAVPVLPFVSFYAIEYTRYLIELLGRDAERTTLMIRWSMWSDIWPDVTERLLLGYGIKGYWQEGGNQIFVLGNRNWVWMPSQAHNGFLEILLQYGVIGFFLLLFMIVVFRWSLLRSRDHAAFLSIWGFQFYFLFLNNSYSSFFGQTTLPWLLTSTLILISARRQVRNPPLIRSQSRRYVSGIG